jgi:hypothetical protein
MIVWLLQEADGRIDELMPKSASFAPISAARYLSLTRRCGEDDLFSSDLTGGRIMRLQLLFSFTLACAPR